MLERRFSEFRHRHKTLQVPKPTRTHTDYVILNANSMLGIPMVFFTKHVGFVSGMKSPTPIVHLARQICSDPYSTTQIKYNSRIP